jgi:3-hydroxyisobutyrate dehydrogenase-like beta-hydroxyacid dehydrogenase
LIVTKRVRERSGDLRVGFVGLGDQGSPIAQRVAQANWPLTLFARRPEALLGFPPSVRVAESVAALGPEADIVEICVVDDEGVDDVVHRQGLLEAMRPGAVLVVHSTVLPETSRRLAREAADRGVEFLDAPVSGGRVGAAAGRLTVMVGGSQGVLDRCEPVFKSFASTVRLVGGAGDAQAFKLVNNFVLAWNLVVAARGLDLASFLGLAETTTAEVMASSMGGSGALELYASTYRDRPQALAHGLRMLSKDMGLLVRVVEGSDWQASVREVQRLLGEIIERLDRAAG